MTPEQFPDAKAWPGEGPPPLGHNEPPLDERLTLQFEEVLRAKGLDARVAEIIEAAGRAPAATLPTSEWTPEMAGKVGDLLALAKEAEKAIEAEREVLNRPLLNAQRAMKSKADWLLTPMNTVMLPLRKWLDAYMAENVPVHGEMGARVGAKEAWEFEVTDYAKLPLAIRRHPTVTEAINKVIRALVKGGERKIAGVKIWPVTKSTVR